MSTLRQALQSVIRKTDDIFGVKLENTEIIFRLPSIKEAYQYSVLLQSCTSEAERIELYEHIYTSVVQDAWLANQAFSIPAGIPETISHLVLYLSGFFGDTNGYTEQLFNSYRQSVNSTISYMKRFICEIYSCYKFHELDQLNYQQLTEVFIFAETSALQKQMIEKPHCFETKQTHQHMPESIGSIISKDAKELKEFENEISPEDQRRVAQQQALRSALIERAKQREQTFNQERGW